MRKFDPWPVFFKREWNRNWPFIVGFAITGAIITKFTAGLTEEDAKNSRFVQEHNRNKMTIILLAVSLYITIAFIFTSYLYNFYKQVLVVKVYFFE